MNSRRVYVLFTNIPSWMDEFWVIHLIYYQQRLSVESTEDKLIALRVLKWFEVWIVILFIYFIYILSDVSTDACLPVHV